MNIAGRINALLKQAALWAGLGVASLMIVLAGVGFLVAAFYVWMTHVVGKAAAAAITGGALMAVAIILLLIGGVIVNKMKKRQPSMVQEFKSTVGFGIRLFTLMVARDPRKALIVSMVAGALAEFITSEAKGRK